MDIYRVYTKKRSEFGRPLYFTDRPTEIIADIRPNIRLSRNYNVSKSVQCGVQNVQKFAEHWVNTIPFETEHQGINHVKGGWPKDIDPINVDQTARFLKRIEKDENYISTILSLGKLVEHTIKQINTIDIYEDYFTNVESNVVEEMPYVRTLNTFRDPQNPQRTANHISWCGNGGEKLAVAYCNLEFQSNTKDLSNDSYIWDIEYSSEPDYILTDFFTCIFDTRKGNAPVEQSLIENSHRDPVYKTIWLHTKLETEFFSASTDGKIFWWDTRRLSEPVETLILDIDRKGRIENSYGAMSLDYEPTMPMKFMVGTEQGSIVACNRKGQTNADKIGHVYAGHSGPVYALQRHPHCLKNFLSIGDWTVRIWSEEVRDDCIMLTRPSMYALTDGQWSPTRSSIFFTTKMNGTLDIWDILFKQNEPTVSVKVTNEPLHCLRVQEPHGRLIACGSQNGTVTLLELSNNLCVQRKNEKSLVNGMFDRETRRTKILEARSRMRRDVQEKSTNIEVITGKITDEYILKERELVEKAEEDFWRIINEEKNKASNAAKSDQLYNPLKDTDRHKSGNYLASNEIHDPSTDQWDTIASMTVPRAAHTVILLNSGKVLVAGGQ
ncbi:unnamed protein product [Adineta steineri]|uniref:Dynein intermediate chain 2, axonemal n=1 Tax=Adineta steineri TaxID=433720 RepID=A0A818T269_9BILA|nr:unnamed protein product [Adineta steineri]